MLTARAPTATPRVLPMEPARPTGCSRCAARPSPGGSPPCNPWPRTAAEPFDRSLADSDHRAVALRTSIEGGLPQRAHADRECIAFQSNPILYIQFVSRHVGLPLKSFFSRARAENLRDLGERWYVIHLHVLLRIFRHRGYSASLGDWTMAMPPRSLIDHNPAVPSSNSPVRTIPITRGPWEKAAERNNTSTDGRAWL